jgi:TolB protein
MLLFSGVVAAADGNQQVILFSYDAITHERRRIHVGEPGFAGLLADGVVHYPIWSPDSQQVAFIAVTRESGLTLFLDDLGESPDSEFVLDQGPLWLSWAHDSVQLIVHRADRLLLVNTADSVVVTELEVRSWAYRVAAWKPQESVLTYITLAGGSNFAVQQASVAAEGLGRSSTIGEISPVAAFLWSRDGAYLAVADASRLIAYRGAPVPVYSRLKILDSVEYRERGGVSDNIMAYFWSPDGAKIAYVTIPDGGASLRWTLFEVATGVETQLVDFVPSAEQLVMFQFFDQYAYSHSLWSPDSRHLVFAGELREGAVTVSMSGHPGHQGSHVFTVDTGSTLEITTVAEGVLGFWSPWQVTK